jgi:histidinol dehydrogenase
MTELFRLPARGSAAYRKLVSRRPVTGEIQDQVGGILGAVRDGGDRALLDLTERYDGSS